MWGTGVMEEREAGHWEESVEMRGCSLGEVSVGSRRAIVWTLEIEGRERRVERMEAPFGCCQHSIW